MNFNCPHCSQVLYDDGAYAGQVVACPHCGGQMQMPGRPAPLAAPVVDFTPKPPPARTYTSYTRHRSHQRQTTDVFAILAFATGILSLLILPIVLAPICYVCAIVSYYRLKENPRLKGGGLRITGAICGAFSILYLLWTFGMFDRMLNR